MEQQQQQMLIPQVDRTQALNFSKKWTHNGIAIPLQDTHIDFATDFANIVLKSFVLECHAKVQAAIKAAQAQDQNQTTNKPQESGIILEG